MQGIAQVRSFNRTVTQQVGALAGGFLGRHRSLGACRLLFEIGDDGKHLVRREMRPGERAHITPKTVHRMTAIEDSDIFEVSTPELDDVIRLEDRYGREDKR